MLWHQAEKKPSFTSYHSRKRERVREWKGRRKKRGLNMSNKTWNLWDEKHVVRTNAKKLKHNQKAWKRQIVFTEKKIYESSSLFCKKKPDRVVFTHK